MNSIEQLNIKQFRKTVYSIFELAKIGRDALEEIKRNGNFVDLDNWPDEKTICAIQCLFFGGHS